MYNYFDMQINFDEYIQQFKVHIMTNDLPKIDGTDEGVRLFVFTEIHIFIFFWWTSKLKMRLMGDIQIKDAPDGRHPN